jgi:hypothetical protein
MAAQANLYKILMIAASLMLFIVAIQDLVQKSRRRSPVVITKSIVQMVLGIFLMYFFITVMYGQ